MKKCSRCGELKIEKEFYKTARNNGLSARCKQCHGLTIKSCEECSKKFEARNNVKYCSDECRAKNGRQQTFKECEYCHNQFGPVNRLNMRFCSKACAYGHRIGKGNPSKSIKRPHTQRAEIKKCVICGKDFRAVTDTKNRKQIYCSQACWDIRAVDYRECGYCKKIIKTTSLSKKKYCNRACANKDMIGEKAPRYKDGKSLERDRARLSNEISVWRVAVFKRDNYRCKECGKNGELQAHHILSWAEYPDKRFCIENGKTLCIDCHGKLHGRNFRKKRK